MAASEQLSGLTDVPKHFFDVIASQAKLTPNKEALVYEQERISYGELMQRIAAVAGQLQAAGVKAKDKVGILFPNHPDYVASFFAAAGLGTTIVPINPLLKSDEIAHILSDSDASTLIVHEHSLKEALKSQAANPVLKAIFVSSKQAILPEDLEAAKNARIDLKLLSQELKSARTVNWFKQIDPQKDLAMLVYTSGTTGKPKGAMLTHFNMLSIFPKRLDIFDISIKDKTLATLPMCHIYGITILMIGTLSRGGTLAIIPRFDAQAVLKLIQDEKLTLVPAVPAMYQFMLMELEKHNYDLSSVRICFSGAAPLPQETIKEIETAFGAVLVEGFGMTETSCVATINPLKGQRKVGSVGPLVPGVEMKVLDDDGHELPVGKEHVGEFWIKGPNIMQGYYKQAEETQKSMKDGWFATGDLGYKDEDGYFFIVGRKKEMIIRGGANIYPREIEDLIMKMEEVQEVAVLGIPDKFMGERVKAVVVLKKGMQIHEDQVKHFCSEHLADYKVPRLIEFRDILPRNSTGKVLKRLLLESQSGH